MKKTRKDWKEEGEGKKKMVSGEYWRVLVAIALKKKARLLKRGGKCRPSIEKVTKQKDRARRQSNKGGGKEVEFLTSRGPSNWWFEKSVGGQRTGGQHRIVPRGDF